ncbi:hypothetical protein GCM10009117_09870 [Gangjinia marincola]|uniref:Lipocalin-like domain-containing protein n=2 Tax=Gangjinia marincola TaxID=578463 RepID=A0ABP3XR85_9FLAO
MLTITSACSTDDDSTDNTNDPTVQIAEVETTVSSGTWRITNYNDSGEDETSDFNGYAFSFNSDGSLVATNGTITYTGTWAVVEDDDSDDDSPDDNDIDFVISFPVDDDNDFEDLNDDWDIESYTDTTINLIDISGGNGGTDILVFERN